MLNQTQIQKIKPHMPVVCSENGQFATVDHVEGADAIKLSKDANGEHHYIPMNWVTSVDSKVHIDRPGDKAMRQWSTEPLVGGKLDSAQDKNRRIDFDSSTANKPLNAQRQQATQQDQDSSTANKAVNTQRQQGPQTQRQALPNNPNPSNRSGGQAKNDQLRRDQPQQDPGAAPREKQDKPQEKQQSSNPPRRAKNDKNDRTR